MHSGKVCTKGNNECVSLFFIHCVHRAQVLSSSSTLQILSHVVKHVPIKVSGKIPFDFNESRIQPLLVVPCMLPDSWISQGGWHPSEHACCYFTTLIPPVNAVQLGRNCWKYHSLLKICLDFLFLNYHLPGILEKVLVGS